MTNDPETKVTYEVEFTGEPATRNTFDELNVAREKRHRYPWLKGRIIKVTTTTTREVVE